MRIGKFIEHFRAAATAADSSGPDLILKFLAVGRQLGYAMYLSLDALTYLDAAGIKRSESAKTFQREAFRAWALGLMCSAASGVYSLYVMKAADTKGDAEKTIEAKRLAR